MLQKVHLRRAWRGGVAGARAGLEGLGWVWWLRGTWQAGASLATLRWQVFKCFKSCTIMETVEQKQNILAGVTLVTLMYKVKERRE